MISNPPEFFNHDFLNKQSGIGVYMKSINVGLIGFGTVGTGVADILLNKKELIRSRLGAELNLSAIADLDVWPKHLKN